MNSRYSLDESQALEIVRASVLDKLPSLPQDDVDLVETGALDSMAWVDTLIAIESATGIRDFGNPWPKNRPRSICTLAEMIRETQDGAAEAEPAPHARQAGSPGRNIALAGWGSSLGSVTIEAEQIEREAGLPLNKIRKGAGIHSVRVAAETEDELNLAQKAAEAALDAAEIPVDAIDLLVSTSSTFLGFPSFAAALHSRLLLPETSGALDVGGACAGLIYSLATAKGLLCTRSAGTALVVAAEVHHRRLKGPQVPGEFHGLFGDGACAFVLTNAEDAGQDGNLRLGDFVWGCSGASASLLRVRMTESAGVSVDFRGEQLAYAAVAQLDRIFGMLEKLSATSRTEVDWFALHQPNPRAVEILADRARIPFERIPLLSRTSGNLGSVTCGASLCHVLTALPANGKRKPLVYMAAVGPGLVWGGTYWN